MVRFEPDAPYPLMQMVSRNGAVDRKARRLRTGLKVGEILEQLLVEVPRGLYIEHGELVLRTILSRRQSDRESAHNWLGQCSSFGSGHSFPSGWSRWRGL